MPAAGDGFILQTQGLTREFKGFVAVSEVDLKVRHGSIHGRRDAGEHLTRIQSRDRRFAADHFRLRV